MGRLPFVTSFLTPQETGFICSNYYEIIQSYVACCVFNLYYNMLYVEYTLLLSIHYFLVLSVKVLHKSYHVFFETSHIYVVSADFMFMFMFSSVVLQCFTSSFAFFN